MSETFLGRLSTDEPLYAYLAGEIVGRVLGCPHPRPSFEIFQIDTSATIFRYYDRRTFINVVCKSYGNKWVHGSQTGHEELRVGLMQREYENLSQLRRLGFDCPPHAVVRPLATNAALNCILVEDYAPGPDLDHFIREARDTGQRDALSRSLSDVAWFLADLHNRTRTDAPNDPAQAIAYFDKILSDLLRWEIISHVQRERLEAAREGWARTGLLAESAQTLVHGDVNPTNFLWRAEHDLTVLDLEAMRTGDCAFDLGCMAAELKHLFWWYTHDAWTSEPFIRHFYATYADYSALSRADLSNLTERARFFMGCTALRIGRNSWLDIEYRQQLIEDAIRCLNI